jgi:5-methyltetrahydrofolate--homocysteine methyltransferase
MLAGRYPKILKDHVVGVEAQKLFNDAQKMMDKIIADKTLTASGVVAFYKANSVGDDLIISDGNKDIPIHFLRQQNRKAGTFPNFCLADYVAPKDSGKEDYIGMFAVTAGLELDKVVAEYKLNIDDYSEIMVKALADRLAEAFAECLHYHVRKNYWGYASNENLSNEEIIDEKYQGIRPAPGYPACPEHTEKKTIFELLQANKVGIQLTESFAMYPASSVSGYYFANPQTRYFGLGKIGKDQVDDYAKRKGLSIEEAEKWLSPVLGY